MERTTRREVDAVFALLTGATGHRVASSWQDEGAWTVDYAACYGGYVIAELLEHGGHHHPFGDRRMPAGQFVQAMRFALRALEASK